MRKVLGTITILCLLSPAVAEAQKDPTFVASTRDKEAPEAVAWNASAQASVLVTTGNSEQTVVSAGVKASRKQGFNKLQFEAGAQYARTSGVETARAWEAKARYDRFLTTHNSLYIAALASGDELAGKDFVGGGQVGYSRQLYKNSRHELVSEVGYDFSYENLESDSVSIHSGRLFAGYTTKLTADTSLGASVEVLLNINSLDIAVPAGEEASGRASPFEDARGALKLDLTTRVIADRLSFNFGFTARHDNFPAYRDLMDPASRADRVDTTTKASLIFNFL